MRHPKQLSRRLSTSTLCATFYQCTQSDLLHATSSLLKFTIKTSNPYYWHKKNRGKEMIREERLTILIRKTKKRKNRMTMMNLKPSQQTRNVVRRSNLRLLMSNLLLTHASQRLILPRSKSSQFCKKISQGKKNPSRKETKTNQESLPNL